MFYYKYLTTYCIKINCNMLAIVFKTNLLTFFVFILKTIKYTRYSLGMNLMSLDPG